MLDELYEHFKAIDEIIAEITHDYPLLYETYQCVSCPQICGMTSNGKCRSCQLFALNDKKYLAAYDLCIVATARACICGQVHVLRDPIINIACWLCQCEYGPSVEYRWARNDASSSHDICKRCNTNIIMRTRDERLRYLLASEIANSIHKDIVVIICVYMASIVI